MEKKSSIDQVEKEKIYVVRQTSSPKEILGVQKVKGISSSLKNLFSNLFSFEPYIKKDTALSPSSVKRKALLIGIRYTEAAKQKVLVELPGAHDDVFKMKKLLIDLFGWKESEIEMILDTPEATPPTKDYLSKKISAFGKSLSSSSSSSSSSPTLGFFYYSGHGSSVLNQDQEKDKEETGYDQTLIASDYRRSTDGIRDDELKKWLVNPLLNGSSKNSKLYVVMDSCHSGTVLDIPPAIFTPPDSISKTEEKKTNHVILLSGCLDTQTSTMAADKFNKGTNEWTWQSVFTEGINLYVRELNRQNQKNVAKGIAPSSATLEDILEFCRLFIQNQYPDINQTPQISSNTGFIRSDETFLSF